MSMSCRFAIASLMFTIVISANLAFGQVGSQDEEWKTASVKVYSGNTFPDDSGFSVKYRISSGEVGGIIAMSGPMNNLLIFVNSSSPGQLIIELPRNIIDSKQDSGIDTRYKVFTSNMYPMPGGSKEATFSDLEKTTEHRTLAINYPVGAANRILISIQGTYAIPEFSEFGIIILGISMITALTMMARFHRELGF